MKLFAIAGLLIFSSLATTQQPVESGGEDPKVKNPDAKVSAAKDSKPKISPKATEPTAEQRERAILLLRCHAAQSREVAVLVADYVQRRDTALSKKPLVSSGALLFVRKPACVVFRAEKPRQSVVRLTPSTYEVYRPRRKRLERFQLPGPQLAESMFAVIGGDIDGLLADFTVSGIADAVADEQGKDKVGSDSGTVLSNDTVLSNVEIRLSPKSEETAKQLRELFVVLAVRTAKAPAKPSVVLHSIAYRDHSGDLVAIELSKLVANPKNAPSADFEVGEGTKVIEHKAGG
jgi:hypothetical protein